MTALATSPRLAPRRRTLRPVPAPPRMRTAAPVPPARPASVDRIDLCFCGCAVAAWSVPAAEVRSDSGDCLCGCALAAWAADTAW